MSEVDIITIMRDMAAGRRNSCGDRWDSSWCDNAADEIERLRAELAERESAVPDGCRLDLVRIHDELLCFSTNYPDSYPMEAMKSHLSRLQAKLSDLLTAAPDPQGADHD